MHRVDLAMSGNETTHNFCGDRHWLNPTTKRLRPRHKEYITRFVYVIEPSEIKKQKPCSGIPYRTFVILNAHDSLRRVKRKTLLVKTQYSQVVQEIEIRSQSHVLDFNIKAVITIKSL